MNLFLFAKDNLINKQKLCDLSNCSHLKKLYVIELFYVLGVMLNLKYKSSADYLKYKQGCIC